MDTTEFIWMNGEMVRWEEATIHVMSHGLHYGAGVFEGIRCYDTLEGPAIFRLSDHIRRLEKSARIYLVTLPYPKEQLAEACKEVVRANGLRECYIRPIVWLGAGDLDPFKAPMNAAVACWPWETYLDGDAQQKGARVKVSSFRRLDPNVIPPAAKATGQYLNSLLVKVETLTAGYDEAIMLNAAGFVADGPSENVFIVRDGVLVTPPTSAGALAGFTRASIITIARDLGLDVVEENFVRSDLYLADEAFFAGTAAEIVPIASVDDRPVGEAHPGPVTMKVRGAFFEAVHGRAPQYASWLEHIGS